MTSDLDIYHSAKPLVDQHGEDAATEASLQAGRLLAAGDMDGQRAWVRHRLELVMPPSLLCGGDACINELLAEANHSLTTQA